MLSLIEGRDRLTLAIWAICGLLVVALGARWLASSGLPDIAASNSAPSQRDGGGGRSSFDGGPSEQGTATPGTPSAGQGTAIVDIAGRVRRPGVYTLPGGSRVFQAIARAGGLLPDADPTAINRAARVTDGSQIVIAKRGSPLAVGTQSRGGSGSGPVSLSSATAEQLDGLDGIGPALAQRIVDWRNAHGGFRSIDDLDQVSGIGPAKLEALRTQVVP